MKLRELKELSDSGLLWLINRTVFHPRGYALALGLNAEREVVAWGMQGDGTETYSFDAKEDQECFEEVQNFFAGLKDEA